MDNPRTPEQETDLGETLRQVLGAIKRRRWWMILTAGFVMLATVAVTLKLPNRYTSEARILVVEQQVPQSVVDATGSMDIVDRLSIISQQILSRAKLVSIVDQFGLYPKDRKELSDEQLADLMRKSIDIKPVDASTGRNPFNSFSISFTGDTAILAKQVTSTLASLYIESHQQAQENQAVNTADLLNDQVNEKRRQLAGLEERRQAAEAQYVDAAPEQPATTEASRLPELRLQLQNTQGNLNRSRQQRLYLESVLNSTLTGSLARLQSERSQLLLRFTAEYPAVKKKDQEIAKVETMLKAQKAGPGAQPDIAADDATVGQLWGQLRSNSQEIEDFSKEQDRLTAAIAEEDARVKASATASQSRMAQIPLRRQQLAQLDREAEILTAEVSDLEKKRQQSRLVADIQQRDEGQQFREIDPPTLPIAPSSPKRLRINAAGAAFGIGLGLALAFLMDSRHRLFYSEKRLAKRFAAPLIIGVPVLQTPRERTTLKFKLFVEFVAGVAVAVIAVLAEYYAYRQG
jgi:polysaccharide biosynthesis transport protein